MEEPFALFQILSQLPCLDMLSISVDKNITLVNLQNILQFSLFGFFVLNFQN